MDTCICMAESLHCSPETTTTLSIGYVLCYAWSLNHVWLFVTPWAVACQALLWGFSRPEYCSGLSCPPPGDLPNQGIKPRSPALQADSLPSEPPGKPKNTWVGTLALLQGIFVTQESNWGLLHCRRILYQLSYQRSPINRLYPNTWLSDWTDILFCFFRK